MPLGELLPAFRCGVGVCAGSCAVRIEERGRLLPALHANATGPSRRRLGAVGASCNRLSCAPVLRHRKSERGVRNSLVRGSTCARANSAKKELALFSLGSERAAKQTTYSLNNMARITLIAALFGGAAAQSTVGCVPASAPLVVVFFCARRRLTLPPPAQPLAEDCRLRVGLGR